MSSILVVNCGSSSLKYQLIDTDSGQRLVGGLVERIGESAGRIEHERSGGEPVEVRGAFADHEAALRAVLGLFDDRGPSLAGLAGVGHRVVHGGSRFRSATLIDDIVESAIADLVPLAPLHNPANLLGIRVLRRLLPDAAHVAVFDTAFHTTLPDVAATYAIPTEVALHHGIRRYGFHGTSHSYVTRRAAALLGLPVEQVNLVIAHVGNGASVTAVAGGRSVDTSMGMSPLEGLVMGTRSGDLDPGIVLLLARDSGLDTAGLDDLLNRRSGLKGLCGESDVRTVRALAASGDPAARLALGVYAYRLRKYVGAYLAVVPGVHALVFTAGVGENDAALRAEVCEPMAHLGLRLDAQANTSTSRASGERRIDDGSGSIRVLVVPTDEEAEIAAQTAEVAAKATHGGQGGTSAGASGPGLGRSGPH